MEHRLIALALLRKYKEEQWMGDVQQFRKAHGAAASSLPAVQESTMELIDKALELLHKKPKDGRVFYWLLYFAYLTDVKLSVDEIRNELEKKEIFLCRSTYFKWKQRALELLGSILEGCSIEN